MTVTDIIKEIVVSYKNKDDDRFFSVIKEYIEREKLKKHTSVVKELEKVLHSKVNNSIENQRRFKETLPIPRDSEKGFKLLEIKNYEYSFDDICLTKSTKDQLEQVMKELKYNDVLSTYNLSYKKKILLCGKPGTGKTLSAQIVSSVLNIPLIYIRFDAIISSYLGETATNLRKVFDFIENGMWIVLFDEFDIIGKNRDDNHEHGEIKRVVNNFLQMLDNFEGESIIFAATNHHNLLDPAIWRRFDDVIYYDLPDIKTRVSLLETYIKPMKREENIDIKLLAEKTDGLSPADIKMIVLDAMKTSIINLEDKLTFSALCSSVERFILREKIKTKNIKK